MSRVVKFRTFFNGMMSKPFKFGEAVCFPDGSLSVGRNFEIMQFTGLHDVNGTEIYEGDIVEVPYVDPMGGLHEDTPDYTTDVIFGRGSFLVHSSHLRAERCTIDNCIESSEGPYVSNYGNIRDWGKCHLKVIGNIHQNHELLRLNP